MLNPEVMKLEIAKLELGPHDTLVVRVTSEMEDQLYAHHVEQKEIEEAEDRALFDAASRGPEGGKIVSIPTHPKNCFDRFGEWIAQHLPLGVHVLVVGEEVELRVVKFRLDL